MQPNLTWWDGSQRTYTDGNNTERVKVIADNMWAKIQLNPQKYIGTEWDKSITPWKINPKSDFFKANWCLPYYDTSENFQMAESPLFKVRSKGYTFYLSCNGSPISGERPGNVQEIAPTAPVWLGTLSREDADISDTVQAAWLALKYSHVNPVIDFDYSKIFVVPMIYSSNGNSYIFNSGMETNWDPTEVYGFGVKFYFKDWLNSNMDLAMDIISLNNHFSEPQWTTTNSWNNDIMYDNGLALCKYYSWDGGYEIGSYQSIGTHIQVGDIYYNDTPYAGTGFNETPYCASDDVAGSIYYIANKAITISPPTDSEDSIWDTTWEPFYMGATYNYGIRRHLRSTITYSDFFDYIKTQLAYLGFRFCPDGNRMGEDIDSQYFYIPEINSAGLATGNYVAASAPEAQNYINNDWSTDFYKDSPYDGTDDDEGGDPNDYDEDNETILNEYRYSVKNYFFNTYAVSREQLRQLSTYMYTDMPTNQASADFLTNNPIDCIISLQLFPITFDTGAAPLDKIMLGKLKARYWDSDTSNWKDILAINLDSQVRVVDCGSCTYYPKFGVNDFRNYEPYCTAELELPYCGNVKIPTSVYLNHTLDIKYIIDLITGACMALVYRDKLAYLSIAGQIGTSIPVSGIQSQDLQANIQRKQTQYGESLINVARSMIGGALQVGGATTAASISGGMMATLGAASGVVSSLNQIEQAQYEIEHIQVPFTMHGSSSPLTSFANEQYPRLIVKRPLMLPEYDPERYAHLIGFACNITAPLSEFSGLTVCATANLDGIAATEAEKQLLRRALLDGIIL